MHLHFVIPDPETFISGGNSYNACTIRALRELQHTVSSGNAESAFDTHADFVIFDSIYFDKLKANTAVPSNAVALIHHLNSMYPLGENYFIENENPLLSKFHRFIATSAFTRNYLTQRGIRENSIIILQPVAQHVDNLSQPSTTKIYALVLANIIPRKGIRELLESLIEEVIAPDYTLQIVGDMKPDPAYASECTELARKDKNLSRTVRFLGAQDDQSLNAIWTKTNLFISSSFMETFGMSIQEACVRRIPALVLNTGHCAAHIVQGINGFAYDTMSELAKGFSKLVSQNAHFTDLQNTARTYTPDYPGSWLGQAKALISFLEQSV